jgi:hypothetical protein
MTLYEFIALDMDERAKQVWEQGEFITGAIDQMGRSNFYSVSDFYVEVELFDDGEGIAGVVPFRIGDRYERMVEHMKLGAL